ncbi:hypothetical protein BDZ89DRAFT_1132375 [Hymenopellis radicata]|nr:hypothetical protein BDZ89DRAFT_1132375 [Hymenopellis radicata]
MSQSTLRQSTQAAFDHVRDVQTVKVNIANYAPPKAPTTNLALVEQRAGLRLLGQLAGNTFEALDSHPDFGAGAITEYRGIYIHQVYSAISLVRFAESWLREHGYPLVPLGDLKAVFAAFRERIIIHYWDEVLYALFQYNPQFGEDPKAMAEEHAQMRVQADLLGTGMLADHITGRARNMFKGGPYSSFYPSLNPGEHYDHTVKVGKARNHFNVISGSGGVNFFSDVHDPGYAGPAVENGAFRIADSINAYAAELQTLGNEVKRDRVAKTGDSGVLLFRGREVYGEKGKERAERGQQAPTIQTNIVFRNERRADYKCTEPPCHAPHIARDPYAHSSPSLRNRRPSQASRGTPRASSVTTLSRGLKKKLAREQKKSEIQYMGTRRPDGTMHPAPGKVAVGERFTEASTTVFNGRIRFFDEFRRSVQRYASEEGIPGLVSNDQGVDVASGSGTRSRSSSYHPKSRLSSYEPTTPVSASSMPPLFEASESDNESYNGDNEFTPGEIYAGEEWGEMQRANMTPVPY